MDLALLTVRQSGDSGGPKAQADTTADRSGQGKSGETTTTRLWGNIAAHLRVSVMGCEAFTERSATLGQTRPYLAYPSVLKSLTLGTCRHLLACTTPCRPTDRSDGANGRTGTPSAGP
jgi:hypothetical protein